MADSAWAPASEAEHDHRVRVLFGARQLIQRYGWCQHTLHDRVGRYSLSGALMAAKPDRDACGWAMPLLRDALRIPMAPETWQNLDGRTSTEVLALLNRAAEMLTDAWERQQDATRLARAGAVGRRR